MKSILGSFVLIGVGTFLFSGTVAANDEIESLVSQRFQSTYEDWVVLRSVEVHGQVPDRPGNFHASAYSTLSEPRHYVISIDPDLESLIHEVSSFDTATMDRVINFHNDIFSAQKALFKKLGKRVDPSSLGVIATSRVERESYDYTLVRVPFFHLGSGYRIPTDYVLMVREGLTLLTMDASWNEKNLIAARKRVAHAEALIRAGLEFKGKNIDAWPYISECNDAEFFVDVTLNNGKTPTDLLATYVFDFQGRPFHVLRAPFFD